MKKVLLLFSALCLCVCAFAINSDEITGKLDMTSPSFDIVRKAFSKDPLFGSFTQTKAVTGSTRKFTSTGTVQIAPGYGIIWYTSKPYSSVLVVGKNGIAQKIRDGEPTHMDLAGNEVYTQIAQVMECVFFGDFDVMQKTFDCYFKAESDKWGIRLVPSDKTIKSFIDHIVILGGQSIDSLLMVEGTGDSVLYEFSDLVSREMTDEEKNAYSM